MTDQYRKVVRVERDRQPGYPAADAAFFECGHMYRYAAGLGPTVGSTRYCFACTHRMTQEPKVKG